MNKINPIGKTSLLVAAMRALESKRSVEQGRLFSDPFAEDLAGAEGFELFHEAVKIAGDQPAVPIRTKYFDDRLQVALNSGIRQIVVLAAGMDARAFRLSFPSETKLFEIDRTEVLDYKNKKLEHFSPHCLRLCLAADLIHDDWGNDLLLKGFHPENKTLWIVEGLSMYLEEQDFIKVFKKISSLSSSNSIFLCDILNRHLLQSPYMENQLKFLASIGAPWLFGTNDPEDFFQKLGWKITLIQAGEVAPERWPFPVAPKNIPNIPRGYYAEGSFFL